MVVAKSTLRLTCSVNASVFDLTVISDHTHTNTLTNKQCDSTEIPQWRQQCPLPELQKSVHASLALLIASDLIDLLSIVHSAAVLQCCTETATPLLHCLIDWLRLAGTGVDLKDELRKWTRGEDGHSISSSVSSASNGIGLTSQSGALIGRVMQTRQ